MVAKLTIENVSHAFGSPGGRRALRVLDDVSLSVEAGEFISVIGASGSGKTTLLRVIAGLESPSAGAVLVDGEKRSGPGGKMGVVFQRDSLWPWRSVLENATFGLEMRGVNKAEAGAKAMRYIEMVGLGGFETWYPHQLSGGMRQRVNLARALTIEPDILLMDEPFAALDAHTRADMQHELQRICRATGKTVLFITHDIDEAIILADRIGVMHAGPASKLKGIVPVTLNEAERERTHDRFMAVYRQVHEMIRDEVAIALQRAH